MLPVNKLWPLSGIWFGHCHAFDFFSQNKKHVFNAFANSTLNCILDECPNTLESFKLTVTLKLYTLLMHVHSYDITSFKDCKV